MNDIKIIYEVVKKIINNENIGEHGKHLPIFSFEGLPGTGKTTQIKKASSDFKKKYGKSYYIDLPTTSSVGLMLRALYSNKEIWGKVQKEAPWINPLLLSCDLQLALKKAKKEGANYVLMARGILSTYYYNYKAYMDIYDDFDIVFGKLTEILQAFAKPTAIVFFELEVEEAHRRVLKRNREPLRAMDQVENMKSDRKLLNKYIDQIKEEVPIYYIDASLDRDSVTDKIDNILLEYLEVEDG